LSFPLRASVSCPARLLFVPSSCYTVESMESRMKKIITDSIVSGAVVIASFFAWRSVERALTVSGASDWIAPIVWFFVVCATLALFFIIVSKRSIVLPILALSLLSSIFFVLHPVHVASVVFAFLLLFLAYGCVQRDLRLSLVIRVLYSTRIGMRMATVAFVIVLTSQYFWTVRTLPAEAVLPAVKSGVLTSLAVESVLRVMDPSLHDVDARRMTVDEFFLTVQRSRVGTEDLLAQIPSVATSREEMKDISPEGTDILLRLDQKLRMAKEGNVVALEPLLVAQARKNLSDALGSELIGSEKIADVLADYLKTKTFSAIGARERQPLSLPVSVTLALLLFITALSIGTLVRAAGEVVAAVLFAFLRRIGCVTITTVQKSVEVLA